MQHCNFNLLSDEQLVQLGLARDRLHGVAARRPLGTVFDLLRVDGLDPRFIGRLLQQGIVASFLDQSLVPRRVAVTTEEELAREDPDPSPGDLPESGDPADFGAFAGASLLECFTDDPFGIFEPLNPARPLKIADCNRQVEIPLAGLGKVRQQVSLRGLGLRQQARRATRSVEFATRLARVRALGSLRSAQLRVLRNARNACTNPCCREPSFGVGPDADMQLFGLALPATRPDGTVIDEVFVIYVLHLATGSVLVSCPKA